MKELASILDWYKYIGNVNYITQDIYDKLELKFKNK
jgi:hypothetical protein